MCQAYYPKLCGTLCIMGAWYGVGMCVLECYLKCVVYGCAKPCGGRVNCLIVYDLLLA